MLNPPDFQTNPRFEALLAAFAARMGLPAPREGVGLELQSDDLTVRVLADTEDDDLLRVEVDIASAQGASASALALLHRINHAARLNHDWQVSLDDDDLIVMHALRSLAETDAVALEAMLDVALERSSALQTLWQAALSGLAGPGREVLQESLPWLGPGAVRG
jgi:hypothetical protein